MTDPPDASDGTHAEEISTVAGLTPLWSTVIRQPSEISDARRTITALLEGSDWSAATVGDLLLAMTELVVNALTHGEALSVDVAVGTTPDPRGLTVTICHVDGGPSKLSDPPRMAAPDDLSGRGRAVVAAVADGFDTVRQAGNEVMHVVRFMA
jgi:anti-sigma regulatory factor (Ser/Thr protein kinase)